MNVVGLFLVFKQKTAYEMLMSDLSSDVCSSDLQAFLDAWFGSRQALRGLVVVMDIRHPLKDYDRQMIGYAVRRGLPAHALLTKADKLELGRASCRARVCQYVSLPLVTGSFNNKKKHRQPTPTT